MDGNQALANAIVIQAANDYNCAIRTLKKHLKSRAPWTEITNLEKFFHSVWYSTLTDVDGEYMSKRLRKAVIK